MIKKYTILSFIVVTRTGEPEPELEPRAMEPANFGGAGAGAGAIKLQASSSNNLLEVPTLTPEHDDLEALLPKNLFQFRLVPSNH